MKQGHADLPLHYGTVPPWLAQRMCLQMFEPMELAEAIEKRLSQSSCKDAEKKQLKELAETLNENDNNILFFGKLKQ